MQIDIVHFFLVAARDSKRMRPDKMMVANSDCKFTPKFWYGRYDMSDIFDLYSDLVENFKNLHERSQFISVNWHHFMQSNH